MKHRGWKYLSFQYLSNQPLTLALLGLLLLGNTTLKADAVVTVAGKTIEGTITKESEDEVILNTPDYGELTFRKVSLSSIRRSSGSPAPAAGAPGALPPAGGNPFNTGGAPAAPAGGGNPFNSGGAPAAPAGGGNPFNTGVAQGNPFNSGPAAPAPAPPAGGNPFASAAPAQPSRPGAYGAAPAPAYGQQPSASVPAATPAPKVYNPAELPEAPVVTLPTVPIAWQGVLFEIQTAEQLRVTPASNTVSSVENAADLYFNGPLRVRTDNTKLRAVLKNGSDLLSINPRSQVNLQASTPQESVVELLNGALWLKLAELPEERRVVVLIQNAEITSTGNAEFRVADALEQGVHVAVTSGEVRVASKSAQVIRTVKAGEMFLIRPEGSVSDVQPLDTAMQYEHKGWAGLELDWFQTESRTTMGVGMLDPKDLVNRNDLPTMIREVGQSFLTYTQDTGQIPTAEDGYTVLLENVHGAPGWSGPYLKGVVPPVDSWGRPLRYTTKNADGSDRPIGIVYSLGEDGRDNAGNPSADITEFVLFYQIKNPS